MNAPALAHSHPPAPFSFSLWPPAVLWLLLPPLELAGARVLNMGLNFVCFAVFLCGLMICFWEAHVSGLEEAFEDDAANQDGEEAPAPWWQRAAAWPAFVGLKNALVLALVATPIAYGYAYWVAHQAGAPEFEEIARPAMAQVEARAQAGVRPAQLGAGLRVPPPAADGAMGSAIGGSVSEAGEISLVRMQPLTILLLTPELRGRGGDTRVRWRCVGAPAELTEAFCLRAQW